MRQCALSAVTLATNLHYTSSSGASLRFACGDVQSLVALAQGDHDCVIDIALTTSPKYEESGHQTGHGTPREKNRAEGTTWRP